MFSQHSPITIYQNQYANMERNSMCVRTSMRSLKIHKVLESESTKGHATIYKAIHGKLKIE